MWNDGTDKDYIAHHGIKGQHWGERRFQYEDGSLTPEGKVRYGYDTGSQMSSVKPHSRNKVVNTTKTAENVSLGKKYSNAPVSGKFQVESSMVMFNEANRKKMINNVDKVIDQIYVNDSPYAKYYSKQEFASDLSRYLSKYPATSGGVSTAEVIQEGLAEILAKVDRKIKLRERSEAVENKRDPVKIYFMLKRGPGRI